jgi:hypothetical protein
MENIKTQFATSLGADFGERTWTFKMKEEDFKVCSGQFAIVDVKLYNEIKYLFETYENSTQLLLSFPGTTSDQRDKIFKAIEYIKSVKHKL